MRYISSIRLTIALMLAAIIASLTVVVPTLVPDFAPSAQAVGQTCKNRTDRHTVKFYHNMPDTSADYFQKAWVDECPKSDGDKVWRIGGKYRFPRGTTPCADGFTGTKIEMTFYPGGYKRSFIIACTGRIEGERHNVDIYVPEKIAPPQPDLTRTVDVVVNITGMWNQGLSDHHKKSVFFYRY